MSAVPVIIHGVFMPDAKGGRDQPIKGTMIGYASVQGLEVGGGPVIPPDVTPPDPPIDVPPDQPAGPSVAVVIKPAPATGGWGIATDSGGSFKWFFTPGAAGAGPKHR